MLNKILRFRCSLTMTYKQNLEKWTHEDKLLKLDTDIKISRDARVLQFKNYIEILDADRIGLNNDKCRNSLLEKCMHMYRARFAVSSIS